VSGYYDYVPPFKLTLVLLAELIRDVYRPLKVIKAPKAPKVKAPSKPKKLTNKVAVTLLVTGY
jgi:hypothetical protein